MVASHRALGDAAPYWPAALGAVAVVAAAAAVKVFFSRRQRAEPVVDAPTAARHLVLDRSNPLISVNYHFLRQCNYRCKFCFHTDNQGSVLSFEEAKKGLNLLYAAGTRKINFSGGEPFLKQLLLGQMCQHAKQLGMSVSIISNGSLATERWFQKYGQYVDIMGISCDSFDPETNERIGRKYRNTDHVEQLRRVRRWCRERNILFKLNTVVCAYNHDEDLTTSLLELDPYRWKVFQCLAIEGENQGENATDRDVQKLLVTDEQFQQFIARHAICHPVVESNEAMRNSYLILDERMRFLNNQNGRKEPSASILEVGVPAALRSAGFDQAMFLDRGGVYEWARNTDAPSA